MLRFLNLVLLLFPHRKQPPSFVQCRAYLMNVVESTRRSKINQLLLMRSFDARGIRCKPSATDKVGLKRAPFPQQQKKKRTWSNTHVTSQY